MTTLVTLWTLALQLGWISLLAFGGANAVLGQIHRLVVVEQGWISSHTFAHLFALSQAAPGPNFLVVSLIGWEVSALAGMVVATLAFTLPTSLLMYQLNRWWLKLAQHPHWQEAIHLAVAPLAVGLVLSSGYLIARAADTGWPSTLLTALTVLAVLCWRQRHQLWWIAAGGLAGVLGWV